MPPREIEVDNFACGAGVVAVNDDRYWQALLEARDRDKDGTVHAEEYREATMGEDAAPAPRPPRQPQPPVPDVDDAGAQDLGREAARRRCLTRSTVSRCS